MTRKASVERQTSETRVSASVDLEGSGSTQVETPYQFFTHALELLARHSGIRLKVKATGDLSHHVMEDVGIVLGEALDKALGKKIGIRRFGFAYVPMDESLARCVVDLSGRPFAVVDFKVQDVEVEGVQAENFTHFVASLSTHLRANVHLEVLYGENNHHKVEAGIKALALALKSAVEDTGAGKIPSTKGVL
ncbi:MAG: imidazoleglycerol-phosphate dehydratase HisB [Promethearchaeota archaeon]